MKICTLTTSFPLYKGHVQSPFIYDLCSSLSQEGMKADVVCPADGTAKLEERMDSFSVHRFHYFWPFKLQKLTRGGGIPSNLKNSLLAKLQFPLFFLFFLLRSMKYAKRCDVIHCHWSFSALAGVILKKLYRKPLVLTERGASANLAMNNWLTRKVLLYVLHNCDYVTANNYDQVKSFARLGVPKNKLKAVPNGIDMDLFRSLNKNVCRKKLGIGMDKKVVLFVGWLIERKGLQYLLPALQQVVRQQKNVICYVIGEGMWERKLKKMVFDLGLEDNVVFLGSQPKPRVVEYLNAADVFVLPSLSEGRPNVVGEALAVGTPVVATHVNGTSEFFSLFNFGFLVPPKNVGRLSKALLSALKKRWSLSQRAKKDLTFFRKQLTWKTSARKYVEIYKRILR